MFYTYVSMYVCLCAYIYICLYKYVFSLISLLLHSPLEGNSPVQKLDLMILEDPFQLRVFDDFMKSNVENGKFP